MSRVTAHSRLRGRKSLMVASAAVLLVAWYGGRSPAPVAQSVVTGWSPVACQHSDSPSVADYAAGRECPPEGFPYRPVSKSTKAGDRETDPYTDYCSNVPDTGLYWDFKNACATHDYIADLKRFGAAGVTEPAMDDQFYRDMLADCKKRNIFVRADCAKVATFYRVGVREGNYKKGDKITSS
jgi:hypothetical protein